MKACFGDMFRGYVSGYVSGHVSRYVSGYVSQYRALDERDLVGV